MKKVVKIIAMAAMASFLSIGAMSCADSIEDDKPAASISTESGKNNNEDDLETPATPSPSEDPTDEPTPETPSTPETPASTPAAKISGSWDSSTPYSKGELTGTGVKWTWATSGATMNDKEGYIVQIGRGSSNKNVATVKVDGACTITVTFRYGGDFDSAKSRDLDIGGKNLPMTSSTDKTKDYSVSYTASAASEIAVKGNGVNIKSIKVE